MGAFMKRALSYERWYALRGGVSFEIRDAGLHEMNGGRVELGIGLEDVGACRSHREFSGRQQGR